MNVHAIRALISTDWSGAEAEAYLSIDWHTCLLTECDADVPVKYHALCDALCMPGTRLAACEDKRQRN